MNPIIAAEEAKLASLETDATKAAEALAKAKQQLVHAKVDGLPEANQRPLHKAIVEATTNAEACTAAVDQQAAHIVDLREELARREREATIAGYEADMAAARDAYVTAYTRFEGSLRQAAEAYRDMAASRVTEHDAAMRCTRFEGVTGMGIVGAVAVRTRIPQPGQKMRQPGLEDVESTLEAYRLR